MQLANKQFKINFLILSILCLVLTNSCLRNRVRNYEDLISVKPIEVFENKITKEVLDTIVNFLKVKETKYKGDNLYVLYVEKKMNVVNVHFSYGNFEIEQYYMQRDDFKGYLNYSGKIFFIYGYPNFLFNSEKEIIKITTKIPKDIMPINEPQYNVLKIHNNKFVIKESY